MEILPAELACMEKSKDAEGVCPIRSGYASSVVSMASQADATSRRSRPVWTCCSPPSHNTWPGSAEAGILDTERIGVEVFYRLANDEVAAIIGALFPEKG